MFIHDDLYAQILQSMPIPCVDLVVMDHAGRLLLLRRRNEPMAEQWWFPGGRVLFGEPRAEAAKRKLKEECGLPDGDVVEELGTFDWFFSFGKEQKVHSVTTLFKILVDSANVITTDQQSYEARWDYPRNWMQAGLDPMMLEGIAAISGGKLARHGQ